MCSSDLTLLFCAALLFPFDIALRRIALPLDKIWALVLAKLRRLPKAPTTPSQVETIQRLQQAKRQETNSLPLSEPTTVEPTEVSTPQRPQSPAPPSASPDSAPLSTTQRLLDIKRKKQ